MISEEEIGGTIQTTQSTHLTICYLTFMTMSSKQEAHGSNTGGGNLTFSFRGNQVPVTWSAAVTPEVAEMTIQSKPFQTWVKRCQRASNENHSIRLIQDTHQEPTRRIDIESVEIQSVDLFGARGVGFAKIKSKCALKFDGTYEDGNCEEDGGQPPTPNKQCKIETVTLPGICLLRGDAVAILVALFCEEDNTVHSLLVEQPR
jgi:hypothetical protein